MAFPPLTPAVKQLLILNAVVFVLNMIWTGVQGTPLGEYLGLSWSGMLEFFGLGSLRLVTYQFVHSFASPMHILGNALVLYFFGTMAEGRLGYRGTWKLYIVAGVVGGLVQIGLAALMSRGDPVIIGASGSCYGLLVYAACMNPRATVLLIFFPIRLGVLAWVLVGMGAYTTYVELVRGGSSGVAHGAHLGGAFFGWVAFRFGWFRDFDPFSHEKGLLRGAPGKIGAWKQGREAKSQANRRKVLDDLLVKVKEQGIQSLTPAEQRFLKKTSKELKD